MSFTPPPPVPDRLRPVSGLGTAVIVLLGAAVAAHVLRVVASWLSYRVLFTVPDGDLDAFTRRLDTPLVLLLASTFLLVPTVLAATVTVLAWVHRAHTNASALSPHLRLRYTPASAVGLLLIPVANLWFLRTVLADLWAGSSPYGRDERGARLIRASWVSTVGTAAVCLVGHVAIAILTAQTYSGTGPVDPSAGTSVATSGMAFATAELVLTAGCVVLFARVVRHISRMQTALLTGWAPAFPAAARPVDASRQGL